MSKDVFVRKDPFGKTTSKSQFEMTDFCSVLLMAKRIRDVDCDMSKLDLKKIPVIRDLRNMPEEAAEEFDSMFAKVTLVLEEVDRDTEEFFNKLAMGDIDFVGDIVNSPEFTQAMGNYLMRKNRLSKGYSMDEAYDEAMEQLPVLKDEMMRFVGGMLMNCFQSLGQEATERGIPLAHASRLLHQRVAQITHEGVMVEIALDVQEFKKLQGGVIEDASSLGGHDPSFG